MGKKDDSTAAPGRSPERQVLAAAITERDQADAREATLRHAQTRARDDAFAARRSVEAAEATLNRARDEARASLVDAYVDDAGGDDLAPDAIAEAERALALANRRLAELQMVEQELSARTGPAPGRSIPNIRVEAAVRSVIKACPTVRHMAQDYATARRAWEQYHSTLRWLASLDCIPDDLTDRSPKPHETYFVDPSPEWTAAISALARDADAQLPP